MKIVKKALFLSVVTMVGTTYSMSTAAKRTTTIEQEEKLDRQMGALLNYISDKPGQADLLAHYLHAYERSVLLYQIDSFLAAQGEDIETTDIPFSLWMNRLKRIKQCLNEQLIVLLDDFDHGLEDMHYGASIGSFLSLQNIRYEAASSFRELARMASHLLTLANDQRFMVTLKLLPTLLKYHDTSKLNQKELELYNKILSSVDQIALFMGKLSEESNEKKNLLGIADQESVAMKYWDVAISKEWLAIIDDSFKCFVDGNCQVLLENVSFLEQQGFAHKVSTFTYFINQLTKNIKGLSVLQKIFTLLKKSFSRSSIQDYEKQWFYHSLPGRFIIADLYQRVRTCCDSRKCSVEHCGLGVDGDCQVSSISSSFTFNDKDAHTVFHNLTVSEAFKQKGFISQDNTAINDMLLSIKQERGEVFCSAFSDYSDDVTLLPELFVLDQALFSKESSPKKNIQAIALSLQEVIRDIDFFNTSVGFAFDINNIIDLSAKLLRIYSRRYSRNEKKPHVPVPIVDCNDGTSLAYWASLGVVGILISSKKKDAPMILCNNFTYYERSLVTQEIIAAASVSPFVSMHKNQGQSLKEYPIILLPCYFIKPVFEFYLRRAESLLHKSSSMKNESKIAETLRQHHEKKKNKTIKKKTKAKKISCQEDLDQQNRDVVENITTLTEELSLDVVPSEDSGEAKEDTLISSRYNDLVQNYIEFFFNDDQSRLWLEDNRERSIQIIRQPSGLVGAMGCALYLPEKGPERSCNNYMEFRQSKPYDRYHQFSLLVDNYFQQGKQVKTSEEVAMMNELLMKPIYLHSGDIAFLIEGKLIHFDPMLLMPWQEALIKNYGRLYESCNGITAGCFIYIFKASGEIRHRCFHAYRKNAFAAA